MQGDEETIRGNQSVVEGMFHIPLSPKDWSPRDLVLPGGHLHQKINTNNNIKINTHTTVLQFTFCRMVICSSSDSVIKPASTMCSYVGNLLAAAPLGKNHI